MELPLLDIYSQTSNASMVSKMSSRRVEVEIREPPSLPKLQIHPSQIKVKVSPDVIDDTELAEGIDFSTGETIFPVIPQWSLNATKANYLRRKSSMRCPVACGKMKRSQEALSYIRIQTEGASGDEDSSSGDSSGSSRGKPGNPSGIKRFRAIARMVKNNLFWSRELRNKTAGDDEDDNGNTFTVKASGDGYGETLSFNVNNFKSQSRTYGGLTPASRKILLLPPQERSDEDINLLKEVIERLKCLEKYSENVKQELARVIHFDSFEDGRKIIQQGYKGLSFYFIVTGCVTVRHAELDERSGQKHTQIIGVLEEGSSFGELALLHDIERQASYYCKGHSEFLRIDKDDFNEVLRMDYEYEYKRRHDALKMITAFKDVNSNALLKVSDQCTIAEAGANKVIVGDTDEVPEFVTFIQQGEVKVVREIIVWRQNLPYGRVRQFLKTDSNKDNQERDRHGRFTLFNFREERHLFTLFHLKKGDYFNTGENLKNTYIIAVEKVELIHIPRILFIRFGLGSQLEAMRTIFEGTLPSDQETFDMYMDNKRWKNYKRSVTMNVVGRSNIKNKARIGDVPLTLRMKDCINIDE